MPYNVADELADIYANPQAHGGGEGPLKKRLKTGGAATDDSPKFEMVLQTSREDPGVMNVAWHYPSGNPRDDSAWIGLYHADRWHGVKLPCPRPDLAGRMGYKYISQNASSGEVNFPLGASKTPLADGEYIFALHGHQDVTVALSCSFTLRNHMISAVSEHGAASSSFASMGGTRRGRGQGSLPEDPLSSQGDYQAPAIVALMQAKTKAQQDGNLTYAMGELGQVGDETRAIQPKKKREGQSTSFSDERPSIGDMKREKPQSKSLPPGGRADDEGIEWKDGTRRCGAIGARGPCGRRWGTCPYHPINGGAPSANVAKGPAVARKRKKEDSVGRTPSGMADISLTPGLGVTCCLLSYFLFCFSMP